MTGALLGTAAAALRLLPPEMAHELAMCGLRAGLIGTHSVGADPRLGVRVGGLSLPHPIGLAAGFDKDARALGPLLRLGFSFVEAGSVTPLAQGGNARPRLFRLAEDRALINRMGFNNAGLEVFAANLANRQRDAGIVGANIGANKASQDRIGDYVIGLERLWPLADYFTINISSPNTPGLRGLQDGAALEDLLGRVSGARHMLRGQYGDKPVCLKVAPDLDEAAIGAISDLVVRYGLDVVIVSNTSLARPASLRSRHRGQAGGLSGRPLRPLAAQSLRSFALALQGQADLIGVGGIETARDVLDRLEAGACAVQIYTAFVYADPGFVARLVTDFAQLLAAEGHVSAEAAIGTRMKDGGAP